MWRRLTRRVVWVNTSRSRCPTHAGRVGQDMQVALDKTCGRVGHRYRKCCPTLPQAFLSASAGNGRKLHKWEWILTPPPVIPMHLSVAVDSKSTPSRGPARAEGGGVVRVGNVNQSLQSPDGTDPVFKCLPVGVEGLMFFSFTEVDGEREFCITPLHIRRPIKLTGILTNTLTHTKFSCA